MICALHKRSWLMCKMASGGFSYINREVPASEVRRVSSFHEPLA